jgi:uncharacterized membrane protein
VNKGRLEAFSDGVFAIVITLLILDVKIPEVAYQQLGEALLATLPKIFAYVMSFLIVSLYWVTHHNIMAFLVKTDRTAL